MAEEQNQGSPPPPPLPPSPSPSQCQDDPPPPPCIRQFDPSRMIGIIRRKSLIKELAAVYHAECLSYCQEILELQKNWEESYADIKTPDDSRKETVKPSKRLKRSR